MKFEVTNDAITAVAVDGFRLARRTFHPEEGTGRELNFVVPAAGLKEVEKILTDVEDNAAFTLGTKHILFQVGMPPAGRRISGLAAGGAFQLPHQNGGKCW